MVKLDLLRQRRAWISAMKKLTPRQREYVQSYYHAKSVLPIGVAGTLGGIALAPATGGYSVLPAAAFATTSGLNIVNMPTNKSEYKKPVWDAIQKFHNGYVLELNRLRKVS